MKKLIASAKKNHYDETFRKCQSQADFWKAINKLSGRKSREEVPALVTEGGRLALSAGEKAEALLNQFSSVFNSSGEPMPTRLSMENHTPPTNHAKWLLRKISTTPSGKAHGVDEIPIRFIKKCGLVLAPCLEIIASRCILEGVFPSIWKTAIVVPVSKVRTPTKAEEFRPISLLPAAAKLVESTITQQLLTYIEPQLADNQFGFRSGRSTVDAILLLQHHILTGFELCEVAKRQTNTLAVYFDVAKAFDSVPFNMLVEILHHKFSIPPNMVNLVSSYLQDRTMCVKVEDTSSRSAPVMSGVPQGSVLGPILFIAFIDEVARLKLSPKANTILYADDMVYLRPLDCEGALASVQDDINIIYSSFQRLRLKLNASECKLMVFSLAPQGPPRNLQIKLGDTTLEVESYKYLGIEMDEKLSFGLQTREACAKAKKGIGALNRSMRKWAAPGVFHLTLSSIALPALLYGIEAWLPSEVSKEKLVEQVQKYAARLVTNDFLHSTTHTDLLQQVHWQPLQHLVAVRRILAVKKYLSGTRFMHADVFPLQQPSTARRSARTRLKMAQHSMQLATRVVKNTREQKLAAHQMRALWNALDEDLVQYTIEELADALKEERVFQLLEEKGVLRGTSNSGT